MRPNYVDFETDLRLKNINTQYQVNFPGSNKNSVFQNSKQAELEKKCHMKRIVCTAGLADSVGFIVIEFDYFCSFLKNMWGDAFLSNCLTYKILVTKSSKL